MAGLANVQSYSGLDSPQDPIISSGDYVLTMCQEPVIGLVAGGKDKDRKPLDPPPVVKLDVSHQRDPAGLFLSNPYNFLTCHLVKVGDHNIETPVPGNKLVGTVVSSLHRLKDKDNQDVAYFVFGDVSVKVEGRFRLVFTLFDMGGQDCTQLASIKSQPFNIFPNKLFPGLNESTYLTRAINDQGVRVRIRKDSRQSQTSKRNKRVAERFNDYMDNTRPQQRQRVGSSAGFVTPSLGASSSQQFSSTIAASHGSASASLTQQASHAPLRYTMGSFAQPSLNTGEGAAHEHPRQSLSILPGLASHRSQEGLPLGINYPSSGVGIDNVFGSLAPNMSVNPFPSPAHSSDSGLPSSVSMHGSSGPQADRFPDSGHGLWGRDYS
ncbi:hypothetical protein BN1723_014669 [Verticillium longisporum]|uniref:Velvet domain-containing protein n=1 Tax=Verticillium longisporum TaxID=100787 RepID=A0A0G4MEU2_VERLO|nr:hypothetical protein BN1723_014669 [Verticillium longisporum]